VKKITFKNESKISTMKKTILMASLIATLMMVSCTATRITSSWREPDKTVYLNNLEKVLVVALFKDETSRRKAEDQMVAYLNGNGLPSYKYLDADFNKKNEEGIRNKIRDDGFDGAVTMRLMDIEKEKVYTSGNISMYPAYYRNFSGYYYRSYANPGYYTTTKIYTVEVNVFSIKEEKIIWTGITKTADPDTVNKLTAEIAEVVYNSMVKEGFISKK
jgi:hypothetical protein